MLLNNIGCFYTECGRMFLMADVSTYDEFVCGLHPLEYELPDVDHLPEDSPVRAILTRTTWTIPKELTHFCWDSPISFHRERWKIINTGTPDPALAQQFTDVVMKMIESRRPNPDPIDPNLQLDPCEISL